MQIDVLTLFPEMFTGVLNTSIIRRAIQSNQISVNLINIRDFAEDKNKVDDYPYGGGPGMILKPEPIHRALQSAGFTNDDEYERTIFLTPQGQKFEQQKAEELSTLKRMVLLCGHYKGIDERIRRHFVDEEISIGDYVLTGGELPAMVMIDAVTRLIPGVLGEEDSARTDSFTSQLLDHPHYTRPIEFLNKKVPDVLISGNHQKIAEWRQKEKLRRTYRNRLELLKELNLTEQELKWLEEIKMEESDS